MQEYRIYYTIIWVIMQAFSFKNSEALFAGKILYSA